MCMAQARIAYMCVISQKLGLHICVCMCVWQKLGLLVCICLEEVRTTCMCVFNRSYTLCVGYLAEEKTTGVYN